MCLLYSHPFYIIPLVVSTHEIAKAKRSECSRTPSSLVSYFHQEANLCFSDFFFLVKAFIGGEEAHVTETQRKRPSAKQRGDSES